MLLHIGDTPSTVCHVYAHRVFHISFCLSKMFFVKGVLPGHFCNLCCRRILYTLTMCSCQTPEKRSVTIILGISFKTLHANVGCQPRWVSVELQSHQDVFKNARLVRLCRAHSSVGVATNTNGCCMTWIMSRTLCDQGLYCYYTGRKHLPGAVRPDAPVTLLKCVVRDSKGILKKRMCDWYKFCV